jgi:hypothetical protein
MLTLSRAGVSVLIAVSLTVAFGVSTSGQGAPPQRRASRAPAVTTAVDEEFARLVAQWTTRPEFSSPLVDHLPKVTGVPTPKDVLGHHVGAPKVLTSTAGQQTYLRALERATPRVKTMVIGRSEEGRDIMVAFVSSEANIKDLEANRQRLKQLADPRSLTDDQAGGILARTKPLYHVTAGLHSTEVSPPEMVMELAYRLAASEEPYIRRIRDNVIVSIAPSVEVDGRDRVVDWYNAHKTDEPVDGSESFGGPPFWGKYVFHDNNRDINYGVDSLRRHLEWYLQWVPPIWHDLHQSQPFLYTFSGQPPNNENLDPILYSELPLFATYEVNKLTSFGMPGVWHFGFVDTWSPGYLGFAASNHNGMLRMYEIYGSDGANTKRMRLSMPPNARPGGGPTSREWYRPLPPYRDVEWSIRNSVNYSETAILAALELTSTFPRMVLENFYKKSRNAIERGKSRAPHAFVLASGQADMTAVARVANLLRLQGIEVVRTDAELRIGGREFPPGSFMVKLNQPYGPLAKTLLERQRYPDPSLRTYDDSAWTMGLMNNIDVAEISDRTVLDAAGTVLSSDVVWKGMIAATGDGGPGPAAYAVRHNGELGLITLRMRLKDLPMAGARASFAVGTSSYPAGSFIIPVTASTNERVRREIESLGLTAAALDRAPSVATSDLDVPRVAVYSTWSSTEKVGWVRLAFDRFEIPYDLIYKEQVWDGNLRARYDAIVIPHQGPTGKGLVYEQAPASKPLPYRKSETFKSLGIYGETADVRGGMGLTGVAALQRFVEEGGLLLTLGVASYFPAEFGLTRVVDAQRTQGNFYAPGPIVRTEVERPEHPVFFGLTRRDLPVRWADGPLLQVPDTSDTPAAEAASGRERATVLLKFQGGEAGVLSGLMREPDQIRNRPAIVEATVGRGRMLLYSVNPIYRWQNFGEHNLVFNALLYHNDLGPVAEATGSTASPSAR